MDGQSKQLADLLDRTAEVAQRVGRSDLVSRVELAKERVLDPRRRIVVVGPLKQGKSQFVNSLLNLNVCSVGDDETTAIPTVVQNSERPYAELVLADPGNEADAVGRLAPPSGLPEAARPDWEATLRGVRKNLILLDLFAFDRRHEPFHERAVAAKKEKEGTP